MHKALGGHLGTNHNMTVDEWTHIPSTLYSSHLLRQFHFHSFFLSSKPDSRDSKMAIFLQELQWTFIFLLFIRHDDLLFIPLSPQLYMHTHTTSHRRVSRISVKSLEPWPSMEPKLLSLGFAKSCLESLLWFKYLLFSTVFNKLYGFGANDTPKETQ